MKEKFNLTDKQVFAIKTLAKVLLIWSIVVICAALMFSCKSVKTEVQYEYRDSVITHHVTDTTHVTIADTIHVEQSSETYKDDELEIQFGEGGGTYNAQTGDATNVTNVKQKSKEKELQKMVYDYKHLADSLAIQNDSLTQALSEKQGEEHMQQNTKEITPRSGWDNFCTWWTIGTWVALLILLVYAGWRLYRKFVLHV